MVNSREVKATSMIMLLIILMKHKSADSSLVQVPSNTTVMVNQSTYFNCSTSIRPIGPKDVIWCHYPLDREGQRNYVYDEGRIMTNYINRFDIEKNLSTGTFNLIVLRPEPKDAGRYECVDDVQEGIGASAELTLLASNFVCESDFDPSGVVGPTQCDRAITPYEAPLSCSVTYIGKNAPQMKWSKSGDSLITLNTHCGTRDNRVTCNTTLTSDLPLNGAVYICQSTTQLFNCSLEVNNVIYAFANNEIRNYFTGDEVICIANTSKQLPCSYKWKKDNTTEVFPNQTLKPPDPGLYRCHAQCLIRNDSCTFTAMVAEISESGPDLLYLWLLPPILVIIGLFLIFRLRRKLKKCCTRADPDNPLLEMDLIPQIGAAPDNPQLEIPQNGIYPPKYESCPYLVRAIKTTAARERRQAIAGLTVLCEELFVVSESSPEVEVYHATEQQEFRFIRRWEISVAEPDGIDSCINNECLYIVGWKTSGSLRTILRVAPTGVLIIEWPVTDSWGYLSVTSDTNIILTLQDENQLMEYSPDGRLIRQIELQHETDPPIRNLWHSIKLANGNFVVCCGLDYADLHGVFIAGTNGKVEQSFGGTKDFETTRLHYPVYLAVDIDGSVLVADRDNSRILLFDSNLRFRKEILSQENNGLRFPSIIYLDESNNLLIVAENDRDECDGQVLVFRLR